MEEIYNHVIEQIKECQSMNEKENMQQLQVAIFIYFSLVFILFIGALAIIGIALLL